MEGATDATSARALPQLSKPDAIDWVYNNYIHNTANSEQRQTVYVMKNVKVKPTIEILKSTDSDIQTPQIEFDEVTKTARITVVNNGFAEFLIRY